MIVGIPQEIKDNEFRVSLPPGGVRELTRHGHTVYVQSSAGNGSGFTDDEYRAAGATILPDAPILCCSPTCIWQPMKG